MNREIEIDVEKSKLWVRSDTFSGRYVSGRRLFAGYEGENEATQLSFTFSADFDGYTISLIFTVDGTDYTVGSYTDDFDYDIPSTYMVSEAVPLRIKAVSGDQIIYSDEIILEVQKI